MGFRFGSDRSSPKGAESSGLAERLRDVIEDDRQQAFAPAAQAETDGGMIRALDAIATELRRMMGEEERVATTLGEVADEAHHILQGDIPHDL
jgi:hypothetical protein